MRGSRWYSTRAAELARAGRFEVGRDRVEPGGGLFFGQFRAVQVRVIA